MVQNISKFTITVTYTHGENSSPINDVRALLNRLRDHNENGEVEIITHDGEYGADDYYTFVYHDGKYSFAFDFMTIDEFVTKYCKHGCTDLMYVLCDYGHDFECESSTHEVKVED